MASWQFWIDRGGTFTDVLALRPDGRAVVEKLLSESPEHYEDAALEAMRRILDANGAAFADVAAIKLGTTVATNALLERKGENVALVVTAGFGDALEIGVQARPKIFALNITKPSLLHRRVIEAQERVSAKGEVLTPLDEARARSQLAAAFEDGYRAAAIACVHGWTHPAHEQRLAAIAREIGFTQVSVSSEVSGLIKFVQRADTTVADAYLSPVVRAYVDRFMRAFKTHGGGNATQLLFMQSNGGL
ncbi:MAG: 5-oxoprolinase, partial [Alphaproteobacteria bacterium]|nr:5-oxoprolinase [Alphaproteobacteria bacterium]